MMFGGRQGGRARLTQDTAPTPKARASLHRTSLDSATWLEKPACFAVAVSGFSVITPVVA